MSDGSEFNQSNRAKAELRLAVDQAAWRSMECFDDIIDLPRGHRTVMAYEHTDLRWKVTISVEEIK